MIPLLVDENFDDRIIRGILRLVPGTNLVRVAEAGLREQADPVVLEFAAAERRVLLTHDVNTVPGYAYQRIADGQLMTGVIVVPQVLGIGPAMDDLQLLIGSGCLEDFNDRVIYLPLRRA